MQHAKRRGRYGGSERTPSKAPSRVVSPLALMCVVASTASACDSRDGRNDATKGSVISSAKPDVDQANRALGSTAVGPDKPETSMAITPAAKSGDALTSVSVAPLSLGRMLNRLRRTDARPFHQPNAAQAAAYRDAIVQALSDSAAPPPVPGFAWSRLSEPEVWVLAEAETNTGAGALVMRAEPRSPVVIQAPHTFFDSGTLPLALEVFDALNASVLMINTQHRAHGVKDAQRAKRARAGKEVTDVAHNAMSYYQAAHEACVKALPQAVVVQLHGYRNGKELRAVVSAAGTNGPAKDIARELNKAWGQPIARIFPDEVQVLGGMTNEQARASRAENHRFVHLELSDALRKVLGDDPEAREKFTRALASGLGLSAASR